MDAMGRDSNMTNPGGEKPRLVSVGATAAPLGIGRSKAWELLRCGALRSVYIGTRRLVPTTAIDEYVARLPEAASGRNSTSR